MVPRTRTRRWRLVPAAGALAVLAGTTGPAAAQVAPPAQLPVAPGSVVPLNLPSEPVAPTIEIYYGLRKVAPIEVPQPSTEVVPAAVIEPSPVVTPSPGGAARTTEAVIDTLREVRDGTNRVTTAAAGLLNKVAERTNPPAESRQIILTTYSGPAPAPMLSAVSAPWLAVPQPAQPALTPVPAPVAELPRAPVVVPATPTQTIVVVRDPVAEPKPEPTVEPARGLASTTENLITLGAAGFAALLGLLAWFRSGRRAAAQEAVPTLLPALVGPAMSQADADGVQLMGQYDAGPLPDSAEKFELGPTYHDEQREKKRVVEQNNAAAVEFILNQNLALLAALNPGASSPQPLIDDAGFALPAETPATTDDDEFNIAVREV